MQISPQRILIIKLSSLGDIVHTLPAVSALRQRFPLAQLTWLVKEAFAPILDGNSDINEVLPVNFSFRKWVSLVQALRKGQFDLVIDFQGLFRSGLLGALAGAPTRVGFARAREGATWFYTHHVSLPNDRASTWRLLEVHAVDRNLAMARFLGAESGIPAFPLPHFSEDAEAVQKIWQSAAVEDKDQLIALAPWTRSELKSWPLDRFVDLVTELGHWSYTRVVLIGGPSDMSSAKVFEALESHGLINLVGRLSLRQLPLVLQRMQLVIGNDSAVIHLAAGVGTSVLAIFGSTHPQATGPYPLEKHSVLRTDLPCSPCGKRRCQNPQYLECLKSITVDAMVMKVQILLGRSSKGQVAVF